MNMVERIKLAYLDIKCTWCGVWIWSSIRKQGGLHANIFILDRKYVDKFTNHLCFKLCSTLFKRVRNVINICQNIIIPYIVRNTNIIFYSFLLGRADTLPLKKAKNYYFLNIAYMHLSDLH